MAGVGGPLSEAGSRPAGRRVVAVAVAAFVVLAMPKAAFGVAWPTVAGDLGREIADLGAILAVYSGGYFIGTLSVGWVVRLAGTGLALSGAAAGLVVAVIGYAAAGTWLVLIGAAALLGIAGGIVDAGINAHVALHHSPGVMGWLHAGFGAGSAAGPALVTGLLAVGAGWRPGFWVVAGLQALLLLALAVTRSEWEGPVPGRPRVRIGRQPIVLLTLIVFMLYVGLEVAAVQWGFTLLTEGRGIGTWVAGLSITGYWIALTGMRVGLGIAGARTPPAPVAAAAALATALTTGLLWWSPWVWVGPFAMVALGAALGPIFPLQTVLTPRRVGAEATTTMVGFQMAAAALGAIVIPGGLGPLVSWWGVGVVPPVLFVTALGLVAADAAARRVSG